MDTFTLVDNKFIIEYLPFAEDLHVRVYLYGLYLCTNPSNAVLDDITSVFDMTEDTVIDIFKYWADLGLVRIVSERPLEVKYLSLKSGNQPPKKFKAEKFSDFNIHLQQLFENRQILPNEFNEYYLFLESYKMDEDALLMIVQYCIDQKGMSVRYPYILTVAKDWFNNGVKSVQDVEQKLEEYEAQSDSMRQVLVALKRKGGADLEEKQMLLKWTKNWGFDLQAVVFAAEKLKNKSFKRLDAKLDDYWRKNIFTEIAMQNFEKRMDSLRDLAININKIIGVFYESLDYIIETYTIPWLNKGFDNEALLKIAHYCFVGGVRSLEGLNSYINSFFKQGCLTKESIDQYISLQIQNDEKIKKIIEATGRVRNVTSNDRESYKLWSGTWGFSDDIILYAAGCSAAQTYPIPAISRLLKNWHDNNITTLEKAKNAPITSQPATQAKTVISREYSKSDLQAIFADNDLFGLDE